MKNKVYLGDGAYAEYDGFVFILTAENGIRATDTVVLETQVMDKLLAFVAAVNARAASTPTTGETEGG